MYTPKEHPEVDLQVQNLWHVFTVAEQLGDEKSVDEFYRDLMDIFGSNLYVLTAMYLVTNWKLWDAFKKDPEGALARKYDQLWDETRDHALEVLKDRNDDLRFFLEVTD